MKLFRHAYSVGIDISDHSIEVLRLNANRIVEAHNRVILDDGIVRNGAILDPEGLAAKLREALAGVRLRSAAVVVSLPESRLFMRVFPVPGGVSGEGLRQALFDQAQAAIPYPQEKAYWDFTAAGRPAGGTGQVLFVGAPREVVDGYAALMKAVGVRVTAFDIESLSLGRALLPIKGVVRRPRADGEGSAPSSMIVDIGARTTTISLFDEENVLAVSVTVPAAGDRLTQALAEKMKIDERTAESLKRQDGLEKKGSDAVAPALEAELQHIVRGISDALRHYESHYQKKVGQILLAGGSALLPGLIRYLSAQLGRPVELGNPLRHIVGTSWTPDYPEILFTNVIGLALRGLEGRRDLDLSGRAGSKARWPMMLSDIALSARPGLVLAALAAAVLAIAVLVIFRFAGQPPEAAIEAAPALPSVAAPPASQEEVKTEPPAPAAVEPAPPEPVSPAPPETETAESAPAPEPAEPRVRIQATPTGWLNVRQGPGANYAVKSRVMPGETYVLLEKNDDWYKIRLDGDNQGWISSQYASQE